MSLSLSWSRYNHAFRSPRFGPLLYNSLSNTFVAMDEPTRAEVERIQADPRGYDFSSQPGLLVQLCAMKALVAEGEEETLLNVIRMDRIERAFDGRFLDLTIAPTLHCNFDCIYCYEQNRNSARMTPEVERGVAAFARRFSRVQHMTLDWFGGEPLLQFDSMCRITEEVARIGIRFDAHLTTNGSLLTEEIIGRLDDLRIASVQITIDGPPEVHDQRRRLRGGGGTFAAVHRNLVALAAGFKGRIIVRVNVDRTNVHLYPETYKFLRETVPGERLMVRPGMVLAAGTPYAHCLDRRAHSDFQLQAFREHGIDEFEFYPPLHHVHCNATTKNAYVIGPEGELYRCWIHVGNKDKVVGSVLGDPRLDLGKIANLMVGVDPFDDPTCRACFFLPVCNGGCPEARFQNKRSEHPSDVCLDCKDHLPEMLEAHYEQKLREEQAAAACPRPAPPAARAGDP